MSWTLAVVGSFAFGFGAVMFIAAVFRYVDRAEDYEEDWIMGRGVGAPVPLSVVTISTGSGYGTAGQSGRAPGLKELRKQIMDSKISVASEILDWASLSEKADEALTSPTPDYDAIDKVLLASGVSNGSMMDPIGLIKALSPSWHISMSSANKDLHIEVRTNDYSGYASRVSCNISFSIAACIADITFRASVKNAGIKFSAENGHTNAAWAGRVTLGVGGGFGLASYQQHMQAQAQGQGQALPSLYLAPTTTMFKPPGST